MTQEHPHDWLLSDFDFELPEALIACAPACPRDAARLLHVTQDAAHALEDKHVFDLPTLLRPGDVLVVNDTKVIPARLFGTRGTVKAEVLLSLRETENPEDLAVWRTLARPGKRLRVGDTVTFAPDFEAEILRKHDDGQLSLRFNVNQETLFALLERHGHVPLPPYIKRPEGDTAEDRANYQTIYARDAGAVAAPTAGLHFTPELLARLEAKGITRETLTLHVGAGTFLPVKTDHVRDHHMHAEIGHLSAETAARLNAARKEGRRIVAVGTTSLRLLESAAGADGTLAPFDAATSIFITPGYRFRAVDALMTNFHLPKSTLFMLVSAFAGLETMRAAYAHAIAARYRFYSYGDATLLEKA